MITGDNQAPVTQKATDHIDEELCLAIFKTLKLSQTFFFRISERGSKRHRPGWGGGGRTPYNDLYGEAPPKRGTFFSRVQVYERVGISQAQVEVYKRVGKSAI